MTITRQLGFRYAFMAAVCLILVIWLGYHEFVVEHAARGISDLLKGMPAETVTVGFLALIPVLLGLGWLWMRRVLAPLRRLTHAAERIEVNNLRLPLPRSMNGDEVDRLAAVFDSMTARLDASFQHIREFTLHASHELKTPLTVMRAQLETVLRESGSLTTTQTECVEGLLHEVRRLGNIVDSLTLLTKADAGLVTLERKPVPFGQLVQETFEDALVLAQPEHVKVTLDECADAPLLGDRDRLRQLLLILVDNAVKYNRPDGGIHISLREHDGAAELRITNDGGGITPETQRRLFGRFVRGENAVGKVEGCGLGLTIAQWLVQAHGGSIELRPEAGEKTTALVRLPLAQATQSVMAEKPVAVGPPPGGGRTVGRF